MVIQNPSQFPKQGKENIDHDHITGNIDKNEYGAIKPNQED